MKITNSIYFTSQSLKKNDSIATKKENEFKNINLNSNPIANLNRSSINFCAMKKSQFNGIDLMMVKQLKAPIQSFNSNEDFQNYCQTILNEKYLGKKNIEKLSYSLDEEAQIHKKAILNEWVNYITIENTAYTPAIQLMILSSLTKNLSIETNHLPAVLDKRKLADTIQEISENASKQKNYTCNFDKVYRNKLLTTTFENETQLDKNLNGWVRIPSKENDPQNFKDNVKKLQILSHETWCTKTYNAEPYLAAGDFHIYFENGKAKLGLRFNDGILEEIQGEKNNGFIPFLYSETLTKYIEENKFKVSTPLQDKIDYADSQKHFYDSIGEEAIKSKDLEKILPFYDFNFEKDANGMMIIDYFNGNFGMAVRPLSLEEIGIKLDDILAKTIRVKNNFKIPFNDCSSTGNIEEIGGNFTDNYSKIKTLGKIKRIGKNLNAECAFELKSLGDLKYVGGDVRLPYFKDFKDKVLNLDYIGGTLIFEDYKKAYKQPNLLLSNSPLSRPITYEEYEDWKIDKNKLTLDEVQQKINEAEADEIFSSIFGEDWFY